MKFKSDIEIQAGVEAGGSTGSNGQVLSSTGSGVAWIDQGDAETAKSLQVTVKNVSGSELTKGTVVHTAPTASPPSGNVIEVIAADYDDTTKMPALGILKETIANGAEGEAVMTGSLSGIATDAFSIGDELYVGADGTLTNVKPQTAGQLIQKIAVCIKSHASNGLIKIFGAGRSNDVPLPLYIDNTNQRLGIGTTSPESKLEVKGNTANALLTLKSEDGGANDAFMRFFDEASGPSYSVGLDSSDEKFKIAYDSDGDSLTTGTKLVIDTLGRVGIGTTSPSEKLTVNGNIAATGTIAGSNLSGTNTGDQDLSVYYTKTESDSRFFNVAGDTVTGDATFNATTFWRVSAADAASQRADARDDATNFSRLHWYGLSNASATSNFRHAWYDGANYIYVTASASGRIDFTGSAATMYIGSDRVFDDGYHPNADKWTTARTLSLAGDASGSVSWDGSGDASLTVTVNNDSHEHSYIKAGGDGPSTEDLNAVANSVAVGRLSYRGYNSASTNKPPAVDNANGVITVGQHNGGYNAQLAFSSDGNMYWRDNPGSTNGSWRTVWDSGNDGSGSGLDADLLDGQHASAFAPVSHTHTWASIPNNSVNAWGGLRHQTNNGYIDFGPANTSHAHIYTDRPNFYFNKQLLVNNNIVWNAGNDGAGSGLDADLLDGIDSANIVYGSGSRKTNNQDPNTAFNSGFYDIYQTNAPTSTWYSYLTMAHTNASNMHGHQIAGSFYSDGDLFNRHYDGNGSFGNWTRIWNAANDGSGSGLDADLLDGVQGSSYLRSDTSDTFTGTLTMSGSINFGSSNGYINLSRGGWITFYEDGNASHGIGSRNNVGNEADSIRINSYGAVYINLDSNNNNTSSADFIIGRHGGAAGTISELFRVSGETGNVGIGTTDPATKLHVTGEIRAYDSGNTYYANLTANSSWGYFNTNAARVYINKEVQVDTGLIGSYNEALQLRTSGTTRMYINNSTGNVGIGTTYPGSKLEIKGDTANALLSLTSSSGGSNDAFMRFYDEGNGPSYSMGLDSSDEKFKIAFDYDSDSLTTGTKLVIDTSGNVGIGTTSPSYKLQLSTNSAAKPSSSTWTVVSDERVKENIKPYEKGLNEILQVNTKTFDYNGKAGFDKTKDNVGIIAQDMIKIFPETIKTYNAKLNETDEEETELYNFDGHALTFALINAIQELKAEIDELKKQINTQ